VKVVQELLRHSSSKMTLDVYAQALTPAKRATQRKVVAMIREDLSVPQSVAKMFVGLDGHVPAIASTPKNDDAFHSVSDRRARTTNRSGEEPTK
jgi:hypothetical protein